MYLLRFMCCLRKATSQRNNALFDVLFWVRVHHQVPPLFRWHEQCIKTPPYLRLRPRDGSACALCTLVQLSARESNPMDEGFTGSDFEKGLVVTTHEEHKAQVRQASAMLWFQCWIVGEHQGTVNPCNCWKNLVMLWGDFRPGSGYWDNLRIVVWSN